MTIKKIKVQITKKKTQQTAIILIIEVITVQVVVVQTKRN